MAFKQSKMVKEPVIIYLLDFLLLLTGIQDQTTNHFLGKQPSCGIAPSAMCVVTCSSLLLSRVPVPYPAPYNIIDSRVEGLLVEFILLYYL